MMKNPLWTKKSKALQGGAVANRKAVWQRAPHEDGRGRIGQGHHSRVTGSLDFDIALGIGGLPRGCVVEIFWPESSARPR